MGLLEFARVEMVDWRCRMCVRSVRALRAGSGVVVEVEVGEEEAERGPDVEAAVTCVLR